MNLLHIITSFPPAYAYGGPPRSSFETARALADRGHDVTVYTTDAKDATSRVSDYSNPEFMDGVEVYRFRNVSNRLSWANMPLAPGMAYRLWGHAGEFDVVHTHEYRTSHTWFAHRYARKHDVPHVLEPRGSIPRWSGTGKKWIYDTVVGNRILAQVDRFVASSQVEAKKYDDVVPEYDPDRVARVPNGINFAPYETLPDPNLFRAEFDIGSDERVVLFLSRLHERKGADLLLEAYDFLATDESTRLVYVGPDEGMRDRLEARVAELGLKREVTFTGPLYDEIKRSAYVAADVFVLPSLDEYESFGLVVLEALACGTPAVVTDVCGVVEWIDTEYAAVCRPERTEIAAAIERQLGREGTDGEAIREWVQANRTWGDVAARLEAVYEDVV